MCGIVGVYQFGEQHVDPVTLGRQVSLLRHRGPDDQALWHDHCVGLGSTRLAIIDLSPTGRQPMRSSDGRFIIVYNGELSNTGSLRASLRDPHELRGTSDTEVLLHTLAQFGVPAGLPRLEGMFAFALYDNWTRRLWLARDPFGIKPLYYHCNRNRLVFASEVKPLLLDPQTPREPDFDTLRQYLLLGYSVDPVTAFHGILRVPPGHYLEIRPDGSHRVVEYWNVVDLMTTPIGDLPEALDEAVRAHSVADVPTGIMLSGGVDSSAILASMARQQLLNPAFRAYNVGLEPEDALHDRAQKQERATSVRTAEHYGAALTKVGSRAVEMISPHEVALSIEEPIGDASGRLIDAVAAAARRNGTLVLMSGHGADEGFAGYRRHVLARYLALLRQPAFRPLGRMLARTAGPDIRTRMFAAMSGDAHPLVSTASLGWGLVDAGAADQGWFPRSRIAEVTQPLTTMLSHWTSLSLLKQMMLLDMRTYLPAQNLINVDKASMRRSVEIRLPFLHRPLAAIGVQSADSDLIERFRSKAMMRRHACQTMPAFLHAVPKSGFGPPLAEHLRSESGRDLLFGRLTRERGLFNPVTVNKLYDQVDSRHAHLTAQLSNLTIIEQWFRTFIDENPLRHAEFHPVRRIDVPSGVVA